MKLFWVASTLILGSQAYYCPEYPSEYCGSWQQQSCDLGYDDNNCWMGQTCVNSYHMYNCPVSNNFFV